MFNLENKTVPSPEPHTPLELMRLAEFMASKYEYTNQTKGKDIKYKEEQQEKFLKIARVLSLFVEDYRVKSDSGLIPALEKDIKLSEKVYEKHPEKDEKTENFAEENIEDRYLALEFVKNNMKSPILGKDFEEWLKTRK